MERVLVLGGSGFLGRRTMRALAEAPGFAAVAASRAAPRGVFRHEWRECDVTRPASLLDALQGVDSVVNCVGARGDRLAAGLRNVLRAAWQLGLRRVVHISSMAVYRASSGLVAENAPLVAPGHGYAGTQARCEALMALYIAQGGDGVVLRPSCIYGPGSHPWSGRIGRWLRAGRMGELGEAGNAACNLIHVRDAAAAILTALQCGYAAGQRFNVSSPEFCSWNLYLQRFAQAIGAPRPAHPAPARLFLEAWLAAPVLGVAQLAAPYLGLPRQAVPDPISPGFLRGLQRNIQLDHRKADAWLGFPRTALEEGLRDTASWFLAEHASPRRRPASIRREPAWPSAPPGW